MDEHQMLIKLLKILPQLNRAQLKEVLNTAESCAGSSGLGGAGDRRTAQIDELYTREQMGC